MRTPEAEYIAKSKGLRTTITLMKLQDEMEKENFWYIGALIAMIPQIRLRHKHMYKNYWLFPQEASGEQ